MLDGMDSCIGDCQWVLSHKSECTSCHQPGSSSKTKSLCA